VYKCPEIQLEIPEISAISVIRKIRPKISEIRLKNLEIRHNVPEIPKSGVHCEGPKRVIGPSAHTACGRTDATPMPLLTTLQLLTNMTAEEESLKNHFQENFFIFASVS